MYSGVPKFVSTFGYINASWTLRADLTAEYVCRCARHLDETACAGRRRACDRRSRHDGTPVDR